MQRIEALLDALIHLAFDVGIAGRNPDGRCAATTEGAKLARVGAGRRRRSNACTEHDRDADH